jgi:hypothetical protein
MIEKPSNQVLAGNYYFQFNSLTQGTYDPPSLSPYPSMQIYVLDTSPFTSESSNSFGTGIKNFVFYGSAIPFSVGDLIKITSLGGDVGEMLGSVSALSWDEPTSTTTMSVDVYQFNGTGASSNWRIRQQWGSTTNALPLNVVQNPNSPATAKLTVFDWETSGGFAQFSVPNSLNSVTTITSDTPTLFSGYTFTQWKWNTYIVEDNSDLHKPWLGTTVTVRVKISKVTTTLDGSTEEFEFRDYTHTFTAEDFDPDSEFFTPAVGHSPSICENFSPDYIDNFTSTFYVVYEPDTNPPVVISSTYVTYSFAEQSWITDISPASFFQPPTS